MFDRTGPNKLRASIIIFVVYVKCLKIQSCYKYIITFKNYTGPSKNLSIFALPLAVNSSSKNTCRHRGIQVGIEDSMVL